MALVTIVVFVLTVAFYLPETPLYLVKSDQIEVSTVEQEGHFGPNNLFLKATKIVKDHRNCKGPQKL